MFEKFTSLMADRRHRSNAGLFILVLVFVCGASSFSQAQKAVPERSVLYKVGAKYPPDLRKNGIGGNVRLALVIDAHGVVQKVTPVGGNAALVDAAISAIKQWKYAPADGPTKMEVQFAFVPDQQ
ncbi:MAG TPA: TonB family protein [Terriglobales bacterium]